jgi:hypothetical protein
VRFTDTLSDPGVVPLAGLTTSHPAGDDDADAVKGIAEPPPAVTETVCAAGAEPPSGAVKLKTLAFSVNGAVTVSVTDTVCGLFDARVELTVTVPPYVPAARPVRFTDTLSDPGVVPLAGLTTSHPAGDDDADAVKGIAEPPPAVTATVCAAGAEPPSAAEKLRLEGAALSAVVTFSVTATDVLSVDVECPAAGRKERGAGTRLPRSPPRDRATQQPSCPSGSISTEPV